MLGSVVLSFLAGLVTILNPCVLPLVPILVASAISKSRFGPLALAAGLVTSFTLFGFTVIAFGYSLGIDERLVRLIAGALLALAGFVLLVPQAQVALSAATAPIANFGQERLSQVSGDGWHGQFAVGLLLGIVWAPCIGPTLGVAIAAASDGKNLVSSFFIFLTFGLGVASTLLVLAYGSRMAVGGRRRMLALTAAYGKPVFGGALFIVGLMVLSGFDKVMETMLVDILPQKLVELTTTF